MITTPGIGLPGTIILGAFTAIIVISGIREMHKMYIEIKNDNKKEGLSK